MKNIFHKIKRRLKRRRTRKKGVRASVFRFGSKKIASGKPKRNFSGILITITLIAVAVSVLSWGIFSIVKLYRITLNRAYRDQNREIVEWKGESRLHVLLLGLDRREGEYAYVDAVSLLMIDPDAKTIGIFNVNTDVAIYVPELEDTVRIRNLYNRGILSQDQVPVLLLEQKLEKLLSIRIDRYVLVDEEGCSRLVDSLSGVHIDNAIALQDEDIEPGGFELEAGSFRLGGSDFLSFMRTDDGGSNLKYQRQNMGVKNILNRFVSYSTFIRLPKVSDAISETVYTDLSRDELIRLGLEISRADEVRSGYTRESAFEQVKIDDEVKLIPIVEEIDVDIRNVFTDAKIGKEQARVEVFNSTAVRGLGSFRARWLRNIGIDVIRVGDTGRDYPSTVIYTRSSEDYKDTIDAIEKSFEEEIQIIQGEPPNIITTGDVVLIIGGNAADQTL